LGQRHSAVRYDCLGVLFRTHCPDLHAQQG
jgi:hypothetical protein